MVGRLVRDGEVLEEFFLEVVEGVKVPNLGDLLPRFCCFPAAVVRFELSFRLVPHEIAYEIDFS